jgi:hypothetical protein
MDKVLQRGKTFNFCCNYIGIEKGNEGGIVFARLDFNGNHPISLRWNLGQSFQEKEKVPSDSHSYR